MDDIVRYKRPAAVLYGPVVAPLGEPAVVAHRTRAGLLEAVRRRTAAGEIASADGLSLRQEDRMWLIDVRLTPASSAELRPRPAWVKPAKVAAGATVALGIPATLGWWMATSLTAAPFALLLVFILLKLGISAFGGRGRTDVLIQQNVNVRR